MITLKTLPEATAQQVFDQVARHLLTQMKRSLDYTEDCVYRGAGGLRCAAGCLISDAEYLPGMEGNSWFGLVESKLVPEQHRALISDLQNLHDINAPQNWKEELHRTARIWGLSTAALDEFAS